MAQPHQKREQRNAEQREIAQQAEVIGIGKQSRLLLDAAVNRAQGHLMSGVRRWPRHA